MPSNNGNGDTYGPLDYLAYVPFELAAAVGGEWDSLPAAHGAATPSTSSACRHVPLGRRVARPRLGLALAFAWAAFPVHGFALETNSNDALVAALVWGPSGAPSLGRGGACLALGGRKFAPLPLAPLSRRKPRPGPRRNLLPFAAGLATRRPRSGGCCCSRHDGIRAFWSRTIGYQVGRDSPFSIWGAEPARGCAPSSRVVPVVAVAPSRCSRSPAAARPARDGRARAALHRDRAHPDALVLPLHPVVLRRSR